MDLNRLISPPTSADDDTILSPQMHPHATAAEDSLLNDATGKTGTTSTNKRAEQNRIAQRAFRERRDARVKRLEAQVALLEGTMAQTDEANRRWEECRTLADHLRHENTMLRATLERAGVSLNGIPSSHSSFHSQSSYGQSSSPTIHNNHVHGVNGIDPSSFSTRATSSTTDQMNSVEPHPALQDATLINGTAEERSRKEKRTKVEDDLRE